VFPYFSEEKQPEIPANMKPASEFEKFVYREQPEGIEEKENFTPEQTDEKKYLSDSPDENEK
jgi:hypothetical protein